MNHVERFRKLMRFEKVDRLPRVEWAMWWDKTLDRWRGEGLPRTDEELVAHPSVKLHGPISDSARTRDFAVARFFGLDPYWQCWFYPRGSSCPAPPGHGKPIIADEADYDRIRPHLYPEPNWGLKVIRPWLEAQARGEALVWITLEGFFWFPRTLLGIEPHLYSFYDKPELIKRINQDLADYHNRILDALEPLGAPVFMTFAEDMSYNHGPMISRGLFDEFIAPYYAQLIPRLKAKGTACIIDSDGDVTDMVPWLKDAGIDGVLPLERQAGVDGMRLREKFPDFLMIGHYDKLVMEHGEAAMRAEFERLLPLMRSGGFIPGVDHQTPPSVSLENYRIYLRLLEEYSEKGAR